MSEDERIQAGSLINISDGCSAYLGFRYPSIERRQIAGMNKIFTGPGTWWELFLQKNVRVAWRGNWGGLVGRREHGVLKWILTRSRNTPYFTITTTVIPFENSFPCVLERSDCSCALFSFSRLLEGKYGFYDCTFVLYHFFI